MPDRPRDTDPATQRQMTALYAAMTPQDKLRRVRDLTRAVSVLALAGLRARYPGESERQLLLRLAELRLGTELVRSAYSLPAGRDGP